MSKIEDAARDLVKHNQERRELRSTMHATVCETGECPCWMSEIPNPRGNGEYDRIPLPREDWCAACLHSNELHKQAVHEARMRGLALRRLERAVWAEARLLAGKGEA